MRWRPRQRGPHNYGSGPGAEVLDKGSTALLAGIALVKDTRVAAAGVSSLLAVAALNAWLDRVAGDFTEAVVESYARTPEQPALPPRRERPDPPLPPPERDFYPAFVFGDLGKFLALHLQEAFDTAYGTGLIRVFATEASLEVGGENLLMQQQDSRDVLRDNYDGQPPILTLVAPGLNEITRSGTAHQLVRDGRTLRHQLRGVMARATAGRYSLHPGCESEVTAILLPPRFRVNSIVSKTRDDKVFSPSALQFGQNSTYMRGLITEIVAGHNRSPNRHSPVVLVDTDGSFSRPGAIGADSTAKPKSAGNSTGAKLRDVVLFSRQESFSLPAEDARDLARHIVHATEPETRRAIAERQKYRRQKLEEQQTAIEAARAERMRQLAARRRGRRPGTGQIRAPRRSQP